jgi:hypothetical protein
VLITRIAIPTVARVWGINPDKYRESRVSHSTNASASWSIMRLGQQPLDTRNILPAGAREKAEQSPANGEWETPLCRYMITIRGWKAFMYKGAILRSNHDFLAPVSNLRASNDTSACLRWKSCIVLFASSPTPPAHDVVWMIILFTDRSQRCIGVTILKS